MRLYRGGGSRRALPLVSWVSPYAALELCLLIALGVQAARLVWTMVTPVNPLGHWRLSEPGEGSAREMLRGFDPFFRLEAAQPAAPAAVTNLQLALFGIRLDAATGRGSAIIATADGVQNSYSVGEEVVPGVTLKAVAFDHVVLARGGRDEELYIDQSGAVPAPAPTAALPSTAPSTPAIVPGGGADLGRAVTIDDIRRDVGFIPRIDNGAITGLSVRAQGAGNTFARIGLKEGDVVTEIGGRPVSGAGDIERLAASLGGGGNLSLGVERGGAVVPIVVTVRAQ